MSSCPRLKLATQGRTLEEARAAIEDGVLIYLKHCYLRGILDNVLLERGFFAVSQGQGGNGDDIGDEFVAVVPPMLDELDWTHTVPMELVADAHRRGLLGGQRGTPCPE